MYVADYNMEDIVVVVDETSKVEGVSVQHEDGIQRLQYEKPPSEQDSYEWPNSRIVPKFFTGYLPTTPSSTASFGIVESVAVAIGMFVILVLTISAILVMKVQAWMLLLIVNRGCFADKVVGIHGSNTNNQNDWYTGIPFTQYHVDNINSW